MPKSQCFAMSPSSGSQALPKILGKRLESRTSRKMDAGKCFCLAQRELRGWAHTVQFADIDNG
jgi:hypothetical protein